MLTSYEIERDEEVYSKAEYIVTASGNKVSRRSVLCGSQNIVINGKTIIKGGCMIRGDLANIKLGKYCVLEENAVIRPPFKKFIKGCAFFPIQLGDYCLVGKGAVVHAATVGNFVRFGKNSYIGRRCVIKDCVVIDDNAVVSDDTVMPPFTRWSGSPAKIVEELPDALSYVLGVDSQDYYDKFTPVGPDVGPGWGTAVRRISAVRRLSLAGNSAAPPSKPPGEEAVKED